MSDKIRIRLPVRVNESGYWTCVAGGYRDDPGTEEANVQSTQDCLVDGVGTQAAYWVEVEVEVPVAAEQVVQGVARPA